jgi:molybdenum cofactor cytidylyltransferase
VIAGIILAAGASSRMASEMGCPKALLEYRGETFAGRLVRVFSKFCDPVIVVLGYHADAIRERVNARFVVNPDPDRGQLSSLQTALAEIPADREGFLFTPVDCPTVEEATLATLIGVFRNSHSTFVIPRYRGRRGHPVCAAGPLMADFLALPPTEETRAAIDARADRITYVDVDDPGVLADIDDAAAYRQLAQRDAR